MDSKSKNLSTKFHSGSSTSKKDSTTSAADKRSTLKKLVVSSSIVAGSGMLVPTKWASPVVNSIVLPAHADTTETTTTTTMAGDPPPVACSTIIVNFNIIVTGDIENGGAGYSIYPAGSCDEIDGDGDVFEGGSIDFTNYSPSHTYGPGQYVVKAAFSGDPGSSSIIGGITASCCTGDSVTLADTTITGASGGDGGCALVTLSEDGSCMIELLPSPCPCP